MEWSSTFARPKLSSEGLRVDVSVLAPPLHAKRRAAIGGE
jgi:hypothetical protein